MIEGVEVTVSPGAVQVTARCALTVVSTAVAGGGLTSARAIVNLPVEKNRPWDEGDSVLEDSLVVATVGPGNPVARAARAAGIAAWMEEHA